MKLDVDGTGCEQQLLLNCFQRINKSNFITYRGSHNGQTVKIIILCYDSTVCQIGVVTTALLYLHIEQWHDPT